MEKSAEAFRTISEVADLLDTPAHVLRFWESRFPQIRPVKRAGGRRYYRPSDIALLTGIKRLLHDDGLTIRGVQKVLREQGIRYVAELPQPSGGPQRIRSRSAAGGGEDRAPDLADVDAAPEEHETVPEAADLPPQKVVRLQARTPAAAAEGTAVSRPAGRDPADQSTAADPTAGRDETVAASPPPPAVDEVVAAPRPADPLPLWAAIDRSQANGTPVPTPAPAAASDPPPADEGIWLPAQLRALRPAAATRHRAELSALYDRLSRLRERVARASDPARN